jgi:hypothetical protein
VTQQTVPELFSVEHYADRYRLTATANEMYARALGSIGGVLNSPTIDDVERVRWIRNIRDAVNLVEGDRIAAREALSYSRADSEADDPAPVSPARVPMHTGAVVDGGQLVDETPASGATPVVTYFTRGRSYVTVVAPTYEDCRDAMFARHGDRWGLSYVAGTQRSTYAVRGYPEREVIIAPGTDLDGAERALAAAADLLQIDGAR